MKIRTSVKKICKNCRLICRNLKVIIFPPFIIFLLFLKNFFIPFSDYEKIFLPQQEVLTLRGGGGARAEGVHKVYTPKSQSLMGSRRQPPKNLNARGVRVLKERDAYAEKRLTNIFFEHFVDTVQEDGRKVKAKRSINFGNLNKPTGPPQIKVTRREGTVDVYDVTLQGNNSDGRAGREEIKLLKKRAKVLSEELDATFVVEGIEYDHGAPKPVRAASPIPDEDFPTTSKSKSLHAAQTKIRPEVEKKLLSTVDPANNEVLTNTKNHTYFSKGDTINSWFDSRQKQAALVRDELDASFFNPQFTVEDLAKAERQVLKLEQKERLALGREELLGPEDLLVELKCRTAFKGFKDDLTRLKRDISHSFNSPNKNVEFLPEKVEIQVNKLFEEGLQVKVYLESALKIFTQQDKNPNLAKNLVKMIDEQADLAFRFQRRAAESQIFVSNGAIQALTQNLLEEPKGHLSRQAMEVRIEVDLSTKESLDEKTRLLELDFLEHPRKKFRLSNNYNTTFTRYRDLNLVDKGLPAPVPSLGSECFESIYVD